MRSHLDLQKGHANAQYTEKALQFYAGLASRAIAAGHCVDIFACSLDQTGLHEMRVLCDRTGGAMVMSDAFSMHMFRESFKQLFSNVDATGYLQMGFNARVSVTTSKNFNVCGCVGGCCSLAKKTQYVGETEIGESGTSEWSMGAIDRNSSLAFFFEVAQGASEEMTEKARASRESADQAPMMGAMPNQCAYVQFQTLYHHPDGRKRLRVTTMQRQMAYPNPNPPDMSVGFDQEAAAVLMTRFAMFQMENIDSVDVVRRLDRILIRLVSKFANFNKDDVHSFRLSNEFTLFPQFMFNLRRSPFVQTFSEVIPKDPKMEGKIGIKVAGFGGQMSINLNLAVAKYAYGEGWERPHLRSSRFNAIRKGH